METGYLTVIETAEYRRSIAEILTDEENTDFINHIAHHPDSGAIIAETGGVRKVRWRSKGKGKSGGARIIYYYYSEDAPLYLFFAFRKGERENLSNEEKVSLKAIARQLKFQLRSERRP